MTAVDEGVGLSLEASGRFGGAASDLAVRYRHLEERLDQLSLEKEALQGRAEQNAHLAVAGEMAARMAHELRNPLGSIALFASLLQKGCVPGSDHARWAGHISSAVGAMDYAISNLLCFSGRPAPRFCKTDLKKVLDEARTFAAHLIQQNRIHFLQSTELLPSTFWGDAHLLRQILLNLILNAVDAMPDGGTLEVVAAPHIPEAQAPSTEPCGAALGARHMIVTVTDTGVGIAPDVLPRIFDPFFTTKGKGTGLGLAVVHNAVTAYGGSIRVSSRPGSGTHFTLILPAAEAKTDGPEGDAQ